MKQIHSMIQSVAVNKNGRIYPPDVLRKAVEEARPKIEAGRMIGEVEPPGDGRSRVSHASHVVRDLRVNQRGEVVGTLEFVDSPAGRAAFEMVKQGLAAGTLCGVGTVKGDLVTDMTLSGVNVTLAAPEFSVPSAVDQLGDIVRDGEDDDGD